MNTSDFLFSLTHGLDDINLDEKRKRCKKSESIGPPYHLEELVEELDKRIDERPEVFQEIEAKLRARNNSKVDFEDESIQILRKKIEEEEKERKYESTIGSYNQILRKMKSGQEKIYLERGRMYYRMSKQSVDSAEKERYLGNSVIDYIRAQTLMTETDKMQLVDVQERREGKSQTMGEIVKMKGFEERIIGKGIDEENVNSNLSVIVTMEEEKRIIGNPDRSGYASIDRGTMLVVENPYVSHLRLENRNEKCAFCFMDVRGHAFVPCGGCQEVVYCSNHCVGKDVEHKLFCGYQLDSILPEVVIMGLKLYFKRRRERKGKTMDDDSCLFIHAIVPTSRQIAGRLPLAYDDEGESYFKGDWEIAEQLQYHLNSRSPTEVLQAVWIAVVFHRFLGDEWNIKPEERVEIARSILQIKCNQFSVKQMSSSSSSKGGISEFTEQTIGYALYAISSLFNHSCKPNAIANFRGNQIAIYASSSISQDAGVCLSYGPLASRMDKESRQAYLKENYYFDCNCDACISFDIDHGTAYKCGNEFCGRLLPKQVFYSGKCPYCKASLNLNAEDDIEELLVNAERASSLSEAISAYSKILELQKSILCPLNRDLGKTYDFLSRLFLEADNLPAAIHCCEFSTSIVHRLFGQSSIEFTHEIAKLCRLYFNARLVDKAKASTSLALRLMDLHYGPDHEDRKELSLMLDCLHDVSAESMSEDTDDAQSS